MGLTKKQRDMIDVTLTVLENRFGSDYLHAGEAEKHINAVLRSVASLINRSTAADIEAARRELQEIYSGRISRS